MDQNANKKPVVLVVLDGVGLSSDPRGNALSAARLDTLDYLMENYPVVSLGAHGKYVGIPPDDMGNSEVGHNAIGTGEIVLQRSAAVDEAVNSGAIFETDSWHEAMRRLKANHQTLHFMGIFSDGNVHSDISHLEKMIAQAKKEGIEHIRIHMLQDGRDVPPQSEPKYINRLEDFIRNLGEDLDYRIASGGGRMVITADRYESDWGMVEKGWRTAVFGEAPQFPDAVTAVEHFRSKNPDLQDQYMPNFVIADKGEAIGKIIDGDALIYFDFRADRAIEMAMAFTYNDFPYFDRGHRPDVFFIGMTLYNEDLVVPEHHLVASPNFERPLSYHLADYGLRQYAISETVKFGHITYFFNGNSYDTPRDELDEEVTSSTEPFNTRPWMKSAETTDKLIEAIKSGEYDFLRINYPGGDMVGHFGEMQATIISLEAIDICLRRIIEAVNAMGGITLITADHGNAEELLSDGDVPKTSHTTNPAPFIIVDTSHSFEVIDGDYGLANIASSIATIFNIDPADNWLPGFLRRKS